MAATATVLVLFCAFLMNSGLAQVNDENGSCLDQDISTFIEDCNKKVMGNNFTGPSPFESLGAIEDPFNVFSNPQDVCMDPMMAGKLARCIFEEYEVCHENTTKGKEMPHPAHVEKAVSEMCMERNNLHKSLNGTEVDACVMAKKMEGMKCIATKAQSGVIDMNDGCGKMEETVTCMAVVNECTEGSPVFPTYGEHMAPEGCNGAETTLPALLTLLTMAVLARLFN